MFLVVPNTYYPLNAFSKKLTSITMSSTESQVVAANHGLRAEGLPCLSLWYFLWRGDAGRKAEPRAEKGDEIVARIDPELDEIRYGTTRPDGLSIADINGLHVQLPRSFQVRHMEDNQATITLLLLGQAGVLRHTDRTQRVSFSWKQQYDHRTFQITECWHIRANCGCVYRAFHRKEQVGACIEGLLDTHRARMPGANPCRRLRSPRKYR